MSSKLPIGTRVKYSFYALRDLRDGYQSEGNPSRKATKRKWYDDKAGLRGTITGYLDCGYCIQWDNDTQSDTISYLVETAE